MPIKENTRCAIVMAGGDGERLRPFVRELRQQALPKQYVNFIGQRSMLEQTIDRVQRIVSPKHIVTVVSAHHLDLAEARQQLSALPRESLIVQPRDRGTWPGMLLPLARLYEKYPDATVAVFPSDHFVLQEDVFLAHVILAMHRVEEQPERMVLLAAPPENADPDFGYLVPRTPRRAFNRPHAFRPADYGISSERSSSSVSKQIVPLLWYGGKRSDFLTIKEFVETPGPEKAQELIARNALWNTGIVVAKATTLVRYTREFAPNLYTYFLRMKKTQDTAGSMTELQNLYESIPESNFSRDFLAVLPSRYPLSLLALPVEEVLWSDCGSKRRVLTMLDKIEYQLRVSRPRHPVLASDLLQHTELMWSFGRNAQEMQTEH